ncbi:GNAT family N-acetyltransferase [Neobacillus mesonae]|nr:GNAT family N-acetyltransferase [Neobacillus mesonae]
MTSVSTAAAFDTMSFPVIETDRLLLRAMDHSDAEALFDYFSKDEVTMYYDLESFTQLEQAEGLIQNWNNRYERQEAIRWGITLKSSDLVIGTCGYHNLKKKHLKAEIGYELHPSYWGEGIMNEAVSAILAFGFKQMGFNRIEALVHCENVNSKRFLEKSSFLQEGILREALMKNKTAAAAALYSLLKREFA